MPKLIKTIENACMYTDVFIDDDHHMVRINRAKPIENADIDQAFIESVAFMDGQFVHYYDDNGNVKATKYQKFYRDLPRGDQDDNDSKKE